MKERPILFAGRQVRSILAGTKTQTRRVVRQPQRRDGAQLVPEILRADGVGAACPYGVPGDRLWVRETWMENIPPSGWIYRATDEAALGACCGCLWRPSIFMPRAASRLTLEVTEVRVQRLRDITEEDARAEGVEPEADDNMACICGPTDTRQPHNCARRAFSRGWESIYGKRAPWASNPWVWAISFRRAA